MIFLYEPTKLIPSECDEAYKHGYPLTDACNLFNFLFENKLAKIITEVNVVLKDSKYEDIYNKIFKQFSPIIKNYSSSDIFDLIFEMEVFPKNIEFENQEDVNKITGLIRKAKIIPVAESKDYYINLFNNDEFYICRDFSAEFINEILNGKTDGNYPIIYYSKAEAKLANTKGYFSLSKFEYTRIKNILDTVTESKQIPLNPSFYTYNPPHPVLKVFDNSILNDLKSLVDENKTRVQFVREDSFLSRMAANHLIKNSGVSYYDLKMGVPSNIDSRNSVVFDNYDVLNNSDEQKIIELSSKVEERLFVILETLADKNSYYVKKYQKVKFPNREELLESISSVFIAMIYERGLINKKLFYLIPLLQKNLLKDLLIDFGSLENLYEVVSKLGSISVDDLYNNVAMWHFIKTELAKLNGNPVSGNQKPEINISIIYNDEKLVVNYNRIPEVFYPSKTTGLLYICAIILNSKHYKGKELDKKNRVDNLRLTILQLRKDTDAIKLLKEELEEDKYNTLDKARKTISDAISKTKEKLPIFNSIIHYSKERYHIINDSEYELIVEYPELEKLITSSQQ